MSSEVKNIVIDNNTHGQRLDNFLLKVCKGVPKSHIYKIIRKGEVRINKKRTKPEYKLAEGDIVRVPPIRTSVAEEVRKDTSKSALWFTKDLVIYEDDDLMVINKPAGIAVHGGSGISQGVIETLRNLNEVKFASWELVHRLDKDTSGCLMIAKKRSMLKSLHEQFRANKVEKCYLALLDGNLTKSATVTAPLYKYLMPNGERRVKVDSMGEPACTEYVPLHNKYDTTLVKVYPLTGKTHQIRVHALDLNMPIIGDDKYGNKSVVAKIKRLTGLNRMFLHAYSIKVFMPSLNDYKEFHAPLDDNLSNCVHNLDCKINFNII